MQHLTERLAIKIGMMSIEDTNQVFMEISVPLLICGTWEEFSQAIQPSMRRLYQVIQQRESSSLQVQTNST